MELQDGEGVTQCHDVHMNRRPCMFVATKYIYIKKLNRKLKKKLNKKSNKNNEERKRKKREGGREGGRGKIPGEYDES